MKYSIKQVNGTQWAVVVKNSAGHIALDCMVGSSHVAAIIAQNENRAQAGLSPAEMLKAEVRFHTLPRLTRRISKRGNTIWEAA